MQLGTSASIPRGANLRHSSQILRADDDFGTSQIVGRVPVTDLLFGRFFSAYFYIHQWM